jgi:aspartate beta-hydroxylase
MSRFLELYDRMMAGALPVSPHALQRPGLYIPDLAARPWHDPAQFPWLQELEAAATMIREEALALPGAAFMPYLEPGREEPSTREIPLVPLHDRGDWNVAYFDLLSCSFDGNKTHCPATARALSRIPRITTSSMFSTLAGGTHIPAHCGPSNAFLRVHLGLVVPDGCEMRVGDETRSWQEGKCLVFDDSFEHEVWNRSSQSRIVLIFYVYHPDFTDDEVRELAFLREHIEHGEEALWKRVAERMLAHGAAKERGASRLEKATR